MRTEIKKWGNSAVIRLPTTVLAELRLSIGSPVEMKTEHNRLVIEPSFRRRYRLEDLLAEMPKKLPQVEGWDEMTPAGKEMT